MCSPEGEMRGNEGIAETAFPGLRRRRDGTLSARGMGPGQGGTRPTRGHQGRHKPDQPPRRAALHRGSWTSVAPHASRTRAPGFVTASPPSRTEARSRWSPGAPAAGVTTGRQRMGGRPARAESGGSALATAAVRRLPVLTHRAHRHALASEGEEGVQTRRLAQGVEPTVLRFTRSIDTTRR